MLVVYNDEQATIAEALAEAARPLARTVTLQEFPTLSRHGEEPPADVAEAMAQADAVFAPTARSLSNTQARLAATRRGVRVATLPTITEEIFRRAMAADYGELKRVGGLLAKRLTAAARARVVSPAGTDIELNLEGRTGMSDDADLREPGRMGNLPGGEAFIAPVESHGDGTIVFDGSLAGYGRLSSPVRLTVEGGRVVAAAGEAGEWLLETLDAGGEGGRSIAELGIGTNPAAILSGNVLEDEKVIGTAHLAFGGNVGLGGTTTASVHIDGVILRPTVELDGTLVVEGGRLLVS